MSIPEKRHQPIEAILLIGPTGAGKTPLGGQLMQRGIRSRRCHHFDFGHEMRRIAGRREPPTGFSWDEFRFICDVLEKGRLLEDKHFPLAEKVFGKFLAASGGQAPDLIVLNGLPRHAGQARDMERHVAITHLLVLECSVEDVCVRIDRNTGGDRIHRTDDARDMMREKLDLYYVRTAPLVEYYRAQGCSLINLRVDPSSTAEDLYAQVAPLLLP